MYACRNLTAIEESISLLSDCDISYDKTEEDLEITYLRSGRKWKRSYSGPGEAAAAENAPGGVSAVRRDVLDAENTENQSPDRKKKRQSVSPLVYQTFFISVIVNACLFHSWHNASHWLQDEYKNYRVLALNFWR